MLSFYYWVFSSPAPVDYQQEPDLQPYCGRTPELWSRSHSNSHKTGNTSPGTGSSLSGTADTLGKKKQDETSAVLMEEPLVFFVMLKKIFSRNVTYKFVYSCSLLSGQKSFTGKFSEAKMASFILFSS